jgi:hypothetical protein
MVRTRQQCQSARDTVESSHSALVTLRTSLDPGHIKVPHNAPLSERPGT